MDKFYVYKITNLINNKIYVGKSNNPKGRWSRHICDSKNNKLGNKQLLFHRAINKYGSNNFIMEILQEYDTDEAALIGEIKFIDILQSNDLNIGYNLTSGGEGGSGYQHTPEDCAAISKRNSGNGNGMYGRPQSPENRKLRSEKVSETKGKKDNSNKPFTPETIQKLKIAVKENKSRKLTDDQKDLIIELYNSGNYIKRDLAVQFFTDEKTIKYVIRYWQEVKTNKSKYLTSDQKNKIIELFLTKLYTYNQISKIMDLHFNRIEAVIKMYQRKNKNA